MSIYDKASLVLIPSGTKTSKVYSQKPVNGDGDFTFSRSTAATRVNADGNIEKETQNLITQSNNFSNSDWTNSGITLTSGQSDPFGGSNGWRYLMTGTISGSYLYQNNRTINASPMVLSFWVKSNTGSNQTFQATANSGSQASPAFTATTEWQRFSWFFVSSSGGSNILLAYNQSQNIDLVIYGAQLEQGLVARDYIETTTAAVEGGITDNVPRLDYTDSSCPALLLEPQRTNIVPDSEYIANWSQTNATTSSNQSTSPEGVNNASLSTATGTGAHAPYDTLAASVTSGANYTISIFYKKGTTNYLRFEEGYTGIGIDIDIDAESATPRNGATNANIEDYGNSWYRASFGFTGHGSGSSQIVVYIKNSSDQASYTASGENVYLYGGQIEAGSYATSYIPTYGTSVTRSNETLSLGGMSSDVALGATSGTLMVEFDYTQESLGDVIQWYSGNTITGRGYLYNRSIGFADTWGSAGLGTTDGVNTKVIWRLDSLSSGTFFKDGVKGNDVSTTTQAWNNINTLYIRGYYGTLNIRQIIFVPYALTNEAAIDLTTL